MTEPKTPSPSPWQADEAEGFRRLLSILPGRVRAALEEHPEVAEASLLLGRPLALSWGSWEPPLVFPDIRITRDDLDYVVAKLSGIKKDGRAGIPGTAHRIAVIYDRLKEVIGLTVRIARYIEVLDPTTASMILKNRGSVMIIGAPGSGKTTLLRNLVHLLAQEIGPHVSVIDTSNEIGGLGQIPHPALGSARWFQVPDPREQADIIRRAIANHGPLVLVLDEVGYNDDAREVEAAARRGVQVVASVHGKHLADVMENPVYAPFLGYPDVLLARRRGRPSFSSAIEVRAKGKLFLIPDLAQAVDRLLLGQPPEGLPIGPAWTPGEPLYPPEALVQSPLSRLARAYLTRDPRLAQVAGSMGLDAKALGRILLEAVAGQDTAWPTINALDKALRSL